MNKLSSTEKREITESWKGLLEDYKLYKPFHFIKRNGPILSGVYLKPVNAGNHYSPQFHIYSLMTLFPVISLGATLPLFNNKQVPDSISYKRHQNEFSKIALEFKTQLPEAFMQALSCTIIDNFYTNCITNAIGYPHEEMKSQILFLYWCEKYSLVESKIDEYKYIINTWPEFAKSKINGEKGWEEEVRSQMNIDQLRNNVDEGIDRFKLNKYIDYGLVCD